MTGLKPSFRFRPVPIFLILYHMLIGYDRAMWGNRKTGFCNLVMIGKFPESAVHPFTLFVICDICVMRVRHVSVTKLIIGVASKTTVTGYG